MHSLLTKSIFIIMLLCSALGSAHAASDLVVTTVASPYEFRLPPE